MKKRKNNTRITFTPDEGALPLLEAAWNRQRSRMDSALATHTPDVDFAQLEAKRRRTARQFLALALCCTAIAVAAAVVGSRSTVRGMHTVGIALACLCTAAAAYCLLRHRLQARHSGLNAMILEFSLPQIATIGFAAVLALVFTSSIPAGDGYAIKSHNSTRAEIVTNIDNIFI